MPVPGPPDASGERSRSGDGPTPGIRVSRRRVLQAGLAGAAALAGAVAIDSGGRRPPLPPVAALPDGALAPGEHPMAQGWLFGGPYAPGAEQPGFDESGFTEITLPHTVTPLSWGDWDDVAWERVWIYRRHLEHAAVAGGRAFVDFEGVMTDATVFLNGAAIGSHQGGYLPFSVELTEHLVAGDNVLAVVVDGRWSDVPPDDPALGPRNVDYLQPAGIYRDVTLRLVPEVFVADVFAKPQDVLSHPRVDVQVTIDSAVRPQRPLALTVQLLDGATRLGSASATLTASGQAPAVTTLTIDDLHGIALWSPEQPRLYQVAATVADGKTTHTRTATIGFREARFATGGFFLNGERYELFGLNRHQLFPYLGMAAPQRLQRRDAELLRNELRCNMVRCSHYPQSRHFLDACDELGLMVWEEPPGWRSVGDATFRELMLDNVRDMIVRDRNRPSVIVWATRLDEMSSYGDEALSARARELAAMYDGTRQTTGAMQTRSLRGWAEDVFAYDDYQSVGDEHRQATLQPPLPGVPYLVSEAVGARDGAPLYRWVDSERTLATQARMHAQVHDIAQGDTGYAGLLGWAGIDYASLHAGDRIWHRLKWPGVLDTFRVPKPGAATYRSQSDPATGVVILPVFFWDRETGVRGRRAMIATNCDRLDVRVGGRPVVMGATPDRAGYPNLTRPPVLVDLPPATGDLRIDGYVDGQPVATVRMSADAARDRLALTLDDASIVGDGSDMSRLTIRAVDAYGNQRPRAPGDVALTVSGPATLIAENPFPLAELGGVGGGFLRSVAGVTGPVTVTGEHLTLGRASAQLTVVPATVTDIGASLSRTQPGASSATSTGATVRGSAVRAALRGALSPPERRLRIARVLRDDGCVVVFDAPGAGRLVIGWYARHGHRHLRWVLVAAAAATVGGAGRAHVDVRLTGPGRALLQRGHPVHVRAMATFTSAGASAQSETRALLLRR